MTPIYIIAEAGVNHNGESDKALQLVDCAADAGADAVKFQTFSTDRLTIKGAPTAEYQQKQSGESDQYNLLKKLELPLDFYPILIQHCREKNIDFLSTPFDAKAADFLIELGIKKIKVPSGELTNLPFLRYLASKKLPMIVSTGMATLQEVKISVDIVVKTMNDCGFYDKNRLFLLHCTSSYPTPLESVNLRSIDVLRKEFQLPCGYSDHTQGILIPILAAAKDACIIEKHFTLDRSLPGPDHKASIEPHELKEMVSQIRSVEKILGDYKKEPTDDELEVRKVVRKSIATARKIAAGEVITQEDLILIRPGTGLPSEKLSSILNRKSVKELPKHYMIREGDFI